MTEQTVSKGSVEPDLRREPRLHVPHAPFRPGDEPRFRTFPQQPGDLDRPDPQAHYDKLSEHAQGLVRVLDDDGHALGPWNPELSPEILRRGLELIARIRAFDSRMMMMQRQGKLSFYLESKGEEAVSIAAGLALRPQDFLFPSYRQQGLMLVRGASIVEMMDQCLTNRRDPLLGRVMPVHYSFKKGKIFTISSPVCTQVPQAVGAAMASDYLGKDEIVATWVGEGASAEGDFHTAINFASIYKPPVILNIVNNQWAISTHCNIASGGKRFAARGLAYGLPSIRVDGNDFLAVYAVTAWAAERARLGAGPTVIEHLTYRCGAHSSSDDPSRYRPGDESRVWPGGDPLRRLSDHLILGGAWTRQDQDALEKEAERDVTMAYKQAEAHGTLADGSFPPAATLFEDVYAEMPLHLRRQRQDLGI